MGDERPTANDYGSNDNQNLGATEKRAQTVNEAARSKAAVQQELASGDLDSVRMYLTKIGCVDLLSREEEVVIAKRIESARNRCA